MEMTISEKVKRLKQITGALVAYMDEDDLKLKELQKLADEMDSLLEDSALAAILPEGTDEALKRMQRHFMKTQIVDSESLN